MEIYIPNKEILPPARGYIIEKINGKIINEQSNAVDPAFTSLLKGVMIGNATSSFGISDLFNSGDVNITSSGQAGTLAGKDGILYEDSGTERSMETTVETANFGVDGRRWKGVMTAGANRSVTRLELGANLVFGIGFGEFNHKYAFVSKGTPLQVLQNQIYEVLWGFSFG